MEEKHKAWDILDHIGSTIAEIKVSREMHRIIYEYYIHTDKTTYQKLYEYEQIGILVQVLYNRIFEEINTLDRLYEELFAALYPPKDTAGNGNKLHNYTTAAEIVRGKAAEDVGE